MIEEMIVLDSNLQFNFNADRSFARLKARPVAKGFTNPIAGLVWCEPT